MAVTDHREMNSQAAEAAEWMHSELRRNNGSLTLDAAWKGIDKRYGSVLACGGTADRWLARPLLSAFRKLTPNVIWDSAEKRWLEQRGQAAEGLRIR